METLDTCSNPGCDQPGTKCCSACKASPYCGPICQTAHWKHHKEECPGHLRKVGMAHLEKAFVFRTKNDWPQALNHADLALIKFKQMKDRPVKNIDDALGIKYEALQFMGRHRDALESAKERYCMYLTNHTHPPAIYASFCLIESCVMNKEYFDAALYARTLWETITMSRDSHIPDNLRDSFTGRGAIELARALFFLAVHGDMPAEEIKKTGVEAIMLARKALDIFTQIRGPESTEVANTMGTLAQLLSFFHNVDDDEILFLHKRSRDISARVYGNLSANVAGSERQLGLTYQNRASRAQIAKDLDQCVANLELSLHHVMESARIYRIIKHEDEMDTATELITTAEENLARGKANKVEVSNTSSASDSLLPK